MKLKKQLKNLELSSRQLYSALLLIVCCFSNCGRKRRYPFSFAKKTVITVATLDLPSVQNVSVKTTQTGKKISWDKTTEEELQKYTQKNTHFVGYNIYCLTKNGFIPKHSLNKTPITTNNYLDTKKRCNYSYLVRTVFKQHDKHIQGPLSRIAQTNKK
ncbi:MAG: hypothetical protein ABH827_01920 [bacterium]